MIVDIIDFGMSPGEAVSSGRYHHQWIPDIIYYEKGIFSSQLRKKLEGRGHTLKERSAIGDVQMIMIQEGVVCGVSDPRHAGSSKGHESEN